MTCRAFLRFSIAAALLAGCHGGPGIEPGELVAVAHPDPASVEEVARDQIETARAELDDKLRRGKTRREVADAFGGLGEIYHAYGLPAAATCYRNAETLDPESFLWPYYLGAWLQSTGDLPGARAALERATALRDDDLPTRLRLGEVLLGLGDPAAAEPHFEKAAGDASFAAAARLGLGRAAADRSDADAAAEHLRTVLELQPGAGSVHHYLGMALRQLGHDDEAEAELERKGGGEVTSPDRLMERIESLAITAGAYLKRGNRALVNGRFEEATGHYRRAIRIDPERVEAHRNLARALLQSQDVDGALEVLRGAAEAVPDDAWIRFDLAGVYGQKGLIEQAIETYRKTLELAPDMVTAHFNLANALIPLDRWDEARQHLERVLELDPGDSRARYLDARSRDRDGQSDEAIARLQALLDDDPAFLPARRDLARLLAASRRLPRARAVFEAGMALDQPPADKAQLVAAFAEFEWQQRRPGRAIAHWRRAVELQPESSPAHVALANGLQVHAQSLSRRPSPDGDQIATLYAEARKHFAHATRIEPTNSTAWLSEARLWVRDLQFQRAKERLEESLSHLPNDPALNHDLARLLATCPEAAVRDGQRALDLARHAFALNDSIDHAETIAMALAELGHYEEAIKWQSDLLRKVLLSGNQRLIARVQGGLQLYQNRTPMRMQPDS